jgi:antitoxin VapB
VPLSIKSPEIERLARAVAKETGESLTDAIGTALQERFERLRRRRNSRLTDERIREILERLDQLPRLDNRSPDDILGYDENGLPH